jgi:hypothetical protein
MDEQNMIGDVRNAKSWLNSQSTTFREMGERLRAVEAAYRNREGEYSSVPREWPESAQTVINSAASEPGRGILRID